MEYKTTFVRIAERVPGLMYEPIEETDRSRIAVLVMHSDEDYLTYPFGPELSKRGYRVLCANVQNKEGVIFNQIQKMESVRAAVQYLRSLPQVKKLLLLGHSGGASLLSAYQCAAENGTDYFRSENYIYPLPEDIEPYPPADGLMLIDSNWGNAAMSLFSIDPGVIDETNGMNLDKEYDLFDTEKGFSPDGAEYSAEFINKFQKGQGARNNRLIDHALERLSLIESGKGNYCDDEPLAIPGFAQGFLNNKLFAQDLHLMSHTHEAHELIHSDGSISSEIVYSVRNPENPESYTSSYYEGARFLTVRSFLSSYAVRTTEDFGYNEDSVCGIDWKSTYSCTPGNVMGVHMPTLIMGMTAGWEYLSSETIYNLSASKDKKLVFVEGATHLLTPINAAQYGDTVKITFDYIDGWLSSGRF